MKPEEEVKKQKDQIAMQVEKNRILKSDNKELGEQVAELEAELKQHQDLCNELQTKNAELEARLKKLEPKKRGE